jgi:hypothetical protein
MQHVGCHAQIEEKARLAAGFFANNAILQFRKQLKRNGD